MRGSKKNSERPEQVRKSDRKPAKVEPLRPQAISESLVQTEERFRDILRSSADLLWEVDENCVFTYCAGAAKDIFGVAAEELVGKRPFDLMPAEEAHRAQSAIGEIFQRKDPIKDFEALYEDRKGNQRWLRTTGVPVLDERGSLKGYRGACKDITEHKKAEEELRLHSKIMTNMAEGIILTRVSDSTIVYTNPKFEEMLGYGHEELVGKNISVVNAPIEKSPEETAKYIQHSLKKTGVWSGEVSNIKKDGTPFWCYANVSTFVHPEHGPVWVAVHTDITERKLAEEALLKSEYEKTLILDNASEIIAYHDINHNILWANRAYLKATGLSLSQIQGKKCYHAWGLDGPCKGCPVTKTIETGEPQGAELTPQNQPHWSPDLGSWLMKAAPVKDKTGNVIGAIEVAYDITERKRAEEQLKEERNLLRTLIDHIPDKVYIKDRNSRFILCNKAVLDYEGVKNESDIIDRTDFDLYEHSKAQRFFDDEQKLMRTGRSVINRERMCPDKAGNPSCILTTKVPLRDGHGNVTGIVVVDRNITERKKGEEEMVRLNRVMETITDVNQSIFRIQDRDELLKKVCKTIVTYAYRMVWIGFCDEKSKLIVPQAQAGFEEGYLESVKITYNDSEHGMGPSGIAVKTAKPDVMRFIATDPRYEPWRAEAIKRGYRSSAAIPIFSENKVIGALNVYADEEDAFGQEEVKLLEELAYDISTGLRGIDEQTRRRQAEHKLLEYQKQLKRLAAQLALAEERERRRIASELHDQVTQSLALAKIKLDTLHASAASHQPLAQALEDISGSLEKAIQDTRSLTFDLSSPILHELGFEAAVAEWLNEQVRDKHGIATEFGDDGQPKPLDEDVRVLLFRNVRELLINVIKYANADKVKVHIRRIDDSIEVTVEDNGIGFDPMEARAMAAKRAEFGLFSIREGLEEMGGRFEIESKPGAGCKATMTTPLKQKGDR